MPSPFPGMDPYIECPELWSDFQLALTVRISAALNRARRPHFASLIQHRVWFPVFDDVLDAEGIRDRYLRVLDLDMNHRVVTVIEVLSPTHKTCAEARDCYSRHRQEMWQKGVHIVEIDLLREGTPSHALANDEHRSRRSEDYRVTVSRHWPPRQDIYAIQLQDPLPSVAIPLHDSEPDVIVDLQAAFTECWQEGPYLSLAHYDEPPPGPMANENVAWCDEILRKAGYRKESGG